MSLRREAPQGPSAASISGRPVVSGVRAAPPAVVNTGGGRADSISDSQHYEDGAAEEEEDARYGRGQYGGGAGTGVRGGYGEQGGAESKTAAAGGGSSDRRSSSGPGSSSGAGSRSSPAAVKVVGVSALDMSTEGRALMLRSPCPRNVGVMQCYIERSGGGFFSSIRYSLYLKKGDEFLMAATKRSGQRTSNFTISWDPSNVDRRGSKFLGKVRSNWVGTEYMVYDDGEAPGSSKGTSGAGAADRQELAIVTYESNVMGARGPRKMRAVLPSVEIEAGGSHAGAGAGAGQVELYRPSVFQPAVGEEAMLDKFKKGRLEGMQQLMNKPPKWSEEVGAYVLNFNGRVTMASVKNFQLVAPDELDEVKVQFGRVGKDLFTLDFRFPLSPLQAFGIALSSFDYKLACE